MRSIDCLFAALVSAAASSMAAPSACASDEERLLTCSTGEKTIAVCGSPGWTSGSGTVQYRFGPPGHAELVLPRPPSTPPAASALAGTLMYSGGGGATLRFDGGDVDEVVYTAVEAG